MACTAEDDLVGGVVDDLDVVISEDDTVVCIAKRCNGNEGVGEIGDNMSIARSRAEDGDVKLGGVR